MEEHYIKTFEEFVADMDNENLEEGKLKNFALASAAAAGLVVGANHFKNTEKPINPETKVENVIDDTVKNPGKDFYPSEDILDYIKSAEGWHQGWKDDGKGNKTTGWGFKITNTLKNKYPKGMTKEQANEYFSDVAVPTRVKLFVNAVPNIEQYTQNQLDALFDLFYNIGYGKFTKGSPSLQTALKDCDYEKIVKEMDHDYNNRRMGGAKKRRDYERQLFLLDVTANAEDIS